jgi:hypothetical protein
MAEEKKRPYMPPPHDTPATNPPVGKRPPTAAERLRESYIQAAEVKATVDVLGPKQNTDSGKGQGGLDPNKMADILAANTNAYMKSMAESLTTLMTKVVESQAILTAGGGKQSDKDKLYDYLIEDIKGLKAKVESGGGDPLEVIDQYHNKMVGWQQQMQSQLGMGPLGAAGATGNVEVMKLTLEVEDRKTERAQLQIQHQAAEATAERRYQAAEAEAQRRYAAERDDLHRRWAQEDKKWDSEFKLKVDQLNQDGVRSQESVGTFKDLAGSFIASLQVNPANAAGAGQGAAAAPPASQKPEVNFPVSHTCTEPDPITGAPCGTQFAWPPGQMSAKCPKCGVEYNLKKAE